VVTPSGDIVLKARFNRKTYRLYFSAQVAGVYFDAIIDSGSPGNLISSGLEEQLIVAECIVSRGDNRYMLKEIEIAGYRFADLDVRLGKRNLDELKVEAILGIHFFLRFRRIQIELGDDLRDELVVTLTPHNAR
jgi:hypothetical protein